MQARNVSSFLRASHEALNREFDHANSVKFCFENHFKASLAKCKFPSCSQCNGRRLYTYKTSLNIINDRNKGRKTSTAFKSVIHRWEVRSKYFGSTRHVSYSSRSLSWLLDVCKVAIETWKQPNCQVKNIYFAILSLKLNDVSNDDY